MSLAKAMVLFVTTMVFWLSVAHAAAGQHSVKGQSPITKRYFANQLDCRDARLDGLKRADAFCKSQRQRGLDLRSVRAGGCWTLTRRTVSISFDCE